MSYASVAAHNAPPPQEQPHPDPALLNTTPPTHSNIIDDTAKVSVVAPQFKEDPHTYTSEARRTVDDGDSKVMAPPAHPTHGHKAKNGVEAVELEGVHLWESAKTYLLRPGVCGGLLGLVNIGLLASVGRTFYLRPHLRRDATALSSTIAVAVALISAEGFAAEKYRQTPRGKEEERRARREGALIFRHLHQQIMRPGILGGLLGLFNAAVLGTLGYFSYINWDRAWDRRNVSAISLGLLTLWSGEGFVVERYLADR
ncbi:hypothetical protein GALMADRAFT_249508 [Galerina marginata CBS 339.88]|uniref:Uncharacterized protein n=1 Tax=Galerina marginata (strain CBS 339.88) TaxID=685588 RepID=A0A067T918_GALM3|nr:hypothetical protein GALMADRAFT_249508 [Galerina marginata CBS 339.88]